MSFLNQWPECITQKIADIENAKKKLSEQNASGVVFTNGCFDLLHIGHVKLLQSAKQLGNFLVVGLNSDLSIKRNKGKNKPIINENDRAVMLAALTFVDLVVFFDEDDPATIVKELRPHILVKGADWPVDKMIGAEIVTKYGGIAVSLYHGYTSHTTSTSIINQCSNNKNKSKEQSNV